jgi:hypothetical protein
MNLEKPKQIVIWDGGSTLVTAERGRRGDPRSRDRRPKTRDGDEPGRLLGRRRNSTPAPARGARGSRPRLPWISTAPPPDLGQLAPGTEGHEGAASGRKIAWRRDAKGKHSAGNIVPNQRDARQRFAHQPLPH